MAHRLLADIEMRFHKAARATVWSAMGQLLNGEIRRLRAGIGLVERQIVLALPKLSPDRIEGLLEELRAAERIWLATFMPTIWAILTMRRGRLEPIENPFGPKVLPMSSVGMNCHPCDRNRPGKVGRGERI
jgi:hypothetical protein